MKVEPVTIRGVTYPSAKAAAEAFGISASSVNEARRRGRLQRVGLKPRGNSPMPVRLCGVDYPSAKIASAQTGIPLWKVYYLIDRGTASDTVLPARAAPAAE